MEKLIFRNLSIKNYQFTQTLPFQLIVISFLSHLAYINIHNGTGIFLILLLLSIISLYFWSYFSGFIVDNENITKFNPFERKSISISNIVAIVHTGVESDSPFETLFIGDITKFKIGFWKKVYLTKKNAIYSNSDIEIIKEDSLLSFNYREDLYTLVVEKVKQNNPETQDTNSA